MTLSLSMIARNEEATIGRVLAQAAQFCDEMVVVDTGSTDRTKEIATAAGARVLDFAWIDDFAAARNHSLNACTGDWVMWLDADDMIPQEVVDRLIASKPAMLTSEMDAFYVPYRISFDAVTGQCTFSLPRERFLRRGPELKWVGVVHEVLDFPGTRIAFRDDVYIEHRPIPELRARKAGRNLAILEKAYAAGDRDTRTLFYYANELRDNGQHEEAIRIYDQYLEAPGVVWEEYSGRLSKGRCLHSIEREDDARAAFLSAVRVDPTRAEAFIGLGRLHYERQEWAQAVPYYAAAAACVRPHDGFIEDADYTYGALDYLGVCLANSGRHSEAIEATKKSLERGNPDVERLRRNLHWSIDQL